MQPFPPSSSSSLYLEPGTRQNPDLHRWNLELFLIRFLHLLFLLTFFKTLFECVLWLTPSAGLWESSDSPDIKRFQRNGEDGQEITKCCCDACCRGREEGCPSLPGAGVLGVMEGMAEGSGGKKGFQKGSVSKKILKDM